MSQNQNSGDNAKPATPSWGTKAGYIGTGVLIGLVVYPFVRKAVSKIQPKMDKIFDELTGKAEGFAEKASDLLAKARESLRDEEAAEDHSRHGHVRSQASGKPKSNA